VTRLRSVFAWLDRHPLALCLPVQGAMLFYNLALLPVWGDETFTLSVVPRSLAQIADRVSRDIHPPLYYFLLHGWMGLPLPGLEIVRARAFSAVWLLLGTAIVYRLWVEKRETPSAGRWFLALWTLSPCLLLYGRMARSYSMQLALASIALYAGLRFLDEPRRRLRQAACSVAVAALLYTHYAPGAAVAGAIAAVAVWRAVRKRDAGSLHGLAVVSALVVAIYAPWLLVLRHAAVKWGLHADVYTPAGNRAGDQILKAAWWLGSFSFGETMPVAVAIAALAVAPLIGWLLWRGMRSAPAWLPLAAIAAAIGFLGATRWVTYPFMPARMLFCFPFFLLLVARGREGRPRAGTAACAAMAAIALASFPSYYRKADFLNKGYAAPLDEMAALVNRDATPGALVAIDAFNADAFPLRALLERKDDVVLLRSQRAFERVAASSAPVVWYIRNGHDTSPDGKNRRLEAELSRRYSVRRHLFQPYSWLELLAIRCAGWPDRPTHFYEVLELRRPE
jgi:hypothetical protein